MIFRERLKNLSFWFSWSLSIVITFSSAISAREANTLFSLFISEEKINIFSLFINFFVVNNRFFSVFIAFLKSSKTIESWVTFVAIFAIFFSRVEKFDYIFSLKCASSLLIQINSKNRDAIRDDDSSLWKERKKETTKEERICRLLLRSTKEKSKRFRTLDIIEFENSVRTTELFEAGKEVSRIRETIWAIFSSI